VITEEEEELLRALTEAPTAHRDSIKIESWNLGGIRGRMVVVLDHMLRGGTGIMFLLETKEGPEDDLSTIFNNQPGLAVVSRPARLTRGRRGGEGKSGGMAVLYRGDKMVNWTVEIAKPCKDEHEDVMWVKVQHNTGLTITAIGVYGGWGRDTELTLGQYNAAQKAHLKEGIAKTREQLGPDTPIIMIGDLNGYIELTNRYLGLQTPDMKQVAANREWTRRKSVVMLRGEKWSTFLNDHYMLVLNGRCTTYGGPVTYDSTRKRSELDYATCTGEHAHHIQMCVIDAAAAARAQTQHCPVAVTWRWYSLSQEEHANEEAAEAQAQPVQGIAKIDTAKTTQKQWQKFRAQLKVEGAKLADSFASLHHPAEGPSQGLIDTAWEQLLHCINAAILAHLAIAATGARAPRQLSPALSDLERRAMDTATKAQRALEEKIATRPPPPTSEEE